MWCVCRLEIAYQRHIALAHAAHDARCALLHIAVMLGALLRGWQYPHRTLGATALQVSIIAVHVLLLVTQRRRELWLRLREPLFVVIQVVRKRAGAFKWTCLFLLQVSCTNADARLRAQ